MVNVSSNHMITFKKGQKSDFSFENICVFKEQNFLMCRKEHVNTLHKPHATFTTQHFPRQGELGVPRPPSTSYFLSQSSSAVCPLRTPSQTPCHWPPLYEDIHMPPIPRGEACSGLSTGFNWSHLGRRCIGKEAPSVAARVRLQRGSQAVPAQGAGCTYTPAGPLVPCPSPQLQLRLNQHAACFA